MKVKEFIETLIETITTEYGANRPLAIAYLVVCALVLIMAIVALVMKIIVFIRYSKANRMPVSNQMTGLETARYALDTAGLTHIKVRKAGIIREALFGNYYNVYTKTIYLRSILGKIDNKKSVTSTALALQKVGLAKLCEEGDKKTLIRNTLSLIGVFGPFLFIPLILIGGVLDYYVLKTDGKIAGMCIVLGVLFMIAGFIVTALNIPVEKKANQRALEMIEEYDLATPQEREVMKNVFDTYIISYICDFILEILRIVQWVLQIVMKAQSSKNK
ncbi:MAG: zinc metallopeptidase [Lachnospiraceae bacterium]|nr:zinc metallopeptidase [Lachnospiraceae bacterium]